MKSAVFFLLVLFVMIFLFQTKQIQAQIIVCEQQIPFIDVSDSSFSVYIQDIFCRGAIKGYSDNTFKPNAFSTRAEAAKIIVGGLDITIDSTGSGFRDVNNQNPFYSYIQTLKNFGYSNGFGDGTFRPNQFITRGEVAQIVAKAKNKDLATRTFGTQDFRDVDNTHVFFKAIEFLFSRTIEGERVVSGYEDGTFRPGNNVTRAELAKIVALAIRIPPLNDYEKLCIERGGEWLEESMQCNRMENDVCLALGGTYVDCASPCGRSFQGMCVQMCMNACYFSPLENI